MGDSGDGLHLSLSVGLFENLYLVGYTTENIFLNSNKDQHRQQEQNKSVG